METMMHCKLTYLGSQKFKSLQIFVLNVCGFAGKEKEWKLLQQKY